MTDEKYKVIQPVTITMEHGFNQTAFMIF